ncbi:hypothetical protein ACFX2C_043502 [Malus domestica]
MPFVALASKLVHAHVTTCCIKTAIYDSDTMAESDPTEASVGALLLLVAVSEDKELSVSVVRLKTCCSRADFTLGGSSN